MEKIVFVPLMLIIFLIALMPSTKEEIKEKHSHHKEIIELIVKKKV